MLKAKQKKCIELLIDSKMTQIEIAEQLQISDQTISNWKKNEEFIDEYEKANRDAIKYLTAKARQKINDLLNANNEQVQLAAAKDILDRAGYKAESKVQFEGSLSTEKSKLDALIEQMKNE